MEEKKLVPKIRFFGFNEKLQQEKLVNLARFSKGKGYSKKDLRDEGKELLLYGSLYTSYKTIIDGMDTFTNLKENSVISKGKEVVVPSSGETKEDIARASAITKNGIIIGGDLNIVQPNQNIDSIYLALNISYGSPKKELIKRAQGSSVVHLYNEDIQNISIIYPRIEEQEKIGEFFKVLDERIANQERKIAKIKALKEAYLSEMFPQEGETVPKRRFKGFEEEWEERTIDEIALRLDNLRVPISATNRIPGRTPYYGANGIQDYVKGFTHDGENVLLAEDGANDIKNYPVHYTNGEIWVNNHAHVLKGKENILNTLFFSYLLKTINLSTYLVGGSRAKLNADVMMQISCKLPQIKEQAKIGEFFKNLDGQIEAEEKKLEKLKKTKEAYLEEMFV